MPAVQAPTSIVNPEAVTPIPVAPAPEPEPAAQEEEGESFNLNSCTVEDLLHIPGCHRELAEAIIRHRSLIGSYQKVED
jgi:DNA uptake protein ComE-like DNA-binding protein